MGYTTFGIQELLFVTFRKSSFRAKVFFLKHVALEGFRILFLTDQEKKWIDKSKNQYSMAFKKTQIVVKKKKNIYSGFPRSSPEIRWKRTPRRVFLREFSEISCGCYKSVFRNQRNIDDRAFLRK